MTFLKSIQVTTDSLGHVSFTDVQLKHAQGLFITSTTTNLTTNDTSKFSAPLMTLTGPGNSQAWEQARHNVDDDWWMQF